MTMHAAPIITLLTDFGLSDPYVGQMKGVLARLCPEAAIIDLCHDVAPQKIVQAAFFLESSLEHFPKGTVFVCVVDPGVGTERNIICASSNEQFFLAPDNGLLHHLLQRLLPAQGPDKVRAWTVDCSRFSGVAATFHGRDIFAPAAAQLAKGESPASLGSECDIGSLTPSPWPTPRGNGDAVQCAVLHVDRFGNAILNLTTDPWRRRLQDCASIYLDDRNVTLTLVNTYAELPPGPNHFGLLAGSQDHLEIACNGASAAKALDLAVESPLTLRTTP